MLQRPGVIHLLAAQHWVVSTAQLAELGVSRKCVAKAARDGLVERVHHGIVGITGHCDRWEARCTTLHLIAPPGSFLSGITAGRLHGLRRMPAEPVSITIREDTRLSAPEWARVSRTSWDDDEDRPSRDDGLVVASPLRTLFALASQRSQRAFEQAAEDAWHRQLLTPASASEYLARVRRRGRTGVARFESWLERAARLDRPATTGLELLLVDLARSAGLPEPRRQYPLRLRSGAEIHLDLAWPDIRFAIEPGHSWWHGGDPGQREDQRRDRECTEVGWQVVRFDETVWDSRHAAIRQIRSMYHARARHIA
jgi:very-short-patch-repair endonuclease